MKLWIYLAFFILDTCIFVLFTIYTVYRVTLIAVLNRVIEINEDLALRIITVSVFATISGTLFYTVTGYRFNTMPSAISGNPVDVSVYSCCQGHPLHNTAVSRR